MKIAVLAPANSIHTVRWANALAERNYQVTIITMHKPKEEALDSKIQVKLLPIKAPLGYYLNALFVRKFINKIKPDLLHTHYATGYGTLARLTNFHPSLLSVWGSDVYEFPYQSKGKKKILVKNLKAADRIASTSLDMKHQTEKFYIPEQQISITPFGIDLERFKVSEKEMTQKEFITIGMIKTMEEKYGPQYLIQAIPILFKKLETTNYALKEKIKILMVGRGLLIPELKKLADELSLNNIITFTGEIPHSEVPEYLNMLDIYCAPSEMESFGVAVIEASACEIPVVVSNVGGLPEVVKNGETGYLVEAKNPSLIAEKLFDLVIDESKRLQFGNNGRKFVEKHYDWNNNVDVMEKIYREIVENR